MSEQLAFQPITPRQRQIGEFIAGNLDGNGYLIMPVEAIAAAVGATEDEVLAVLKVVWRLEPVGSGARGLAECLRVQLESKGQISPLVERVLDALDELGEASPVRVARRLGVSLAELEDALGVLRQCNPRPGAQFSRSSTPIWPEVIVEQAQDDAADGSSRYSVRLQDFYLPHLQVNARYKTMATSQRNHDAEAFLREKLKEAEALISNIEYRRTTLYKVACCIVEMQAAFLDEGYGRIRPLTMEQVARACDLSESTVSRIVNGNYMQTPRGLFELRFFFQAVASSEKGCDVSQASVKHRISEIVQEEDPRHPLSDQDIAGILAEEGAAVSRRTVNKYRADLGIPAQSFRRRA